MGKGQSLALGTLLSAAMFLVPAAVGAQSDRGGDAPLDVMLALDNSGSMKRNDPQRVMRSAAAAFIHRLPADAQAGIVVFDKAVVLALPLTPVRDTDLTAKVDRALLRVDYAGQWTDLPGAVERSLYELGQQGRPGARKVVVLLTDGMVDLGDPARNRARQSWLLTDLVDYANQRNILVFGVAFTDDADFELIQSLSSKTHATHFRLESIAEVNTLFDNISAALRSVASAPRRAPESESPPAPAPTSPSAPVHQPESLTTSGWAWRMATGFAIVSIGLLSWFAYARYRVIDVPAVLQDNLDPAQTYAIATRVFRIGSVRYNGWRRNDLVVPLPTISRAHATIRYRAGKFFIADDGSVNHTFLDRTRLQPGHVVELHPGNILRFDTREFRFGLMAGVAVPRDPRAPTAYAPLPAQSGAQETVEQDMQRIYSEQQCLNCGQVSDPEKLTTWLTFRVCRACEAAIEALPTYQAKERETLLKTRLDRRHPTIDA
jgi:Mg-chelatase subunit ChlD